MDMDFLYNAFVQGILPFLSIIVIVYVILFIPVQIARFFTFRRKRKELTAFKITAYESLQRHYAVLMQFERFLTQRITLTNSFTQGKNLISQDISYEDWQNYESDFAAAVKATEQAVKKYSTLRTYPQFLQFRKNIEEQRIYMLATKRAYNLAIYNYNKARKSAILVRIFAELSGNKAQKLADFSNDAPDKLLPTESQRETPPNFPPLKTDAEFKTFYDTVLVPTIQPLEELRREYAGQIWKILFIAAPIILVSVIMLLLFGEKAHEHPLGILFSVFPIAIAVTLMVASRKIKAIKNRRADHENETRNQRLRRIIQSLKSGGEEFSDYEVDFLKRVITPIVSFVHPQLHCDKQVMPEPMFIASGLFPKPDKYSNFIGLQGLMGNTRFMLSEVYTQCRSDTEHINRNPRYYIQFIGLFYKANFNKLLNNPIYLIPSTVMAENLRTSRRRTGAVLHQYDIYKNNTEIHITDQPDFSKSFAVFAKDAVEAYTILTPPLIQFFVEIQARFKGKKIYASFVQGQFYLAIHNGKIDFKPTLMKTLLNYDKINKHFDLIRWAVEISQALDKLGR